MTTLIIIQLILAIALVIFPTIFQSIDGIKALEKKTVINIVRIIITTFFEQIWIVITLLLFLLFFYIAYQFNTN